MPEFILLAVCGMVGALLYSFPIFLAALNSIPPGRFAWASLCFSVVVGTTLAPILVPMLGYRWPFLIAPNPYPLAVGVGLAVNPLAPIIVKKLTGWADAYTIGPKK